MDIFKAIAVMTLTAFLLISVYFLYWKKWSPEKNEKSITVSNLTAYLIIATVGLAGITGWSLAKGWISLEGTPSGFLFAVLGVVALFSALSSNRGR